jgi:hypothetical protein
MRSKLLTFYGEQFGHEHESDGHWYYLHCVLAKQLMSMGVKFQYLIPEGLTNRNSYISEFRAPSFFNKNIVVSFKERHKILSMYDSIQSDSFFIYEGNLNLVILLSHLTKYYIRGKTTTLINIFGTDLLYFERQNWIFKIIQRRLISLTKSNPQIIICAESNMAKEYLERNFKIKVEVFDLWPINQGIKNKNHCYYRVGCSNLIIPSEWSDLEYIYKELNLVPEKTAIWIPKEPSKLYDIEKLNSLQFSEIISGRLSSKEYNELLSRFCRVTLAYTGDRWKFASSARILELIEISQPFAVAESTVLHEIAQKWLVNGFQSYNPSAKGSLSELLNSPHGEFPNLEVRPSVEHSAHQLLELMSKKYESNVKESKFMWIKSKSENFLLITIYIFLRKIQPFNLSPKILLGLFIRTLK